MELGLARQDEYEQVDALVAGSDLPLDDIELCRAAQYVVRDGDEVVATAALEIRGRDAILRSVAVASGRRGERLGERIVAHTIEEARQRDLRGLYLLTETASGFFPRFGFVQEDRGDDGSR